MPQIVDTPIEFTCPVCGKIIKTLGGEGLLGPIPLVWHGGKDGKDYCRCGSKKVNK
jgi:hypothetical protein